MSTSSARGAVESPPPPPPPRQKPGGKDRRETRADGRAPADSGAFARLLDGEPEQHGSRAAAWSERRLGSDEQDPMEAGQSGSGSRRSERSDKPRQAEGDERDRRDAQGDEASSEARGVAAEPLLRIPLERDAALLGLSRQPPPPPGPPPLELLARQMLRQVTVRERPDRTTSMELELSSGRLGQLRVELELRRGRVEGRFKAARELDLQLLRGAIPELQAGLEQRGIDAGPLRVELCTAGDGGPGRDARRDRGQPEQGSTREPTAPQTEASVASASLSDDSRNYVL